MAVPEDIEQYVLVRVPERAGELLVYIERSVLESMDPEAEEMYFVMDLTRRYKLHLGRPAGELLQSAQ